MKEHIFKGITTLDAVKTSFEKIKSALCSNHVIVQKDNRAHMSPSRRQVIIQAAEALIKKLVSLCPGCGVPGFDVTDYLTGLTCERCGLRSERPLKELWACPDKVCSYFEERERERERADGIQSLDPSECNW